MFCTTLVPILIFNWKTNHHQQSTGIFWKGTSTYKNCDWAQCWWLTPVILAIQDAEIRRIAVKSELRQIVHKTLSQEKSITRKGWWSDSRCRPWVQTLVLQKKNIVIDSIYFCMDNCIHILKYFLFCVLWL
jgi:hypothetical protein